MDASPLDIRVLTVVGQRLRQAREAKDTSLEQIAETTHIGLGRLKALEQGDPSNLPEPVYVQGFIRKYAQAVGLNYDALMAEARAKELLEKVEAQPKTRFKPKRDQLNTAATPIPSGAEEPPPVAVSAPFLPKQSYLILSLLALTVGLATVLLRKPSAPEPASNLTLAPPPPPAAAIRPESSPSKPVQQTKAVKLEPEADGQTAAMVEAKGPVWLEIWVDGQKQPLERLQPGQVLKLQVKQSLRLYPGRPDLVSVQLGDRRNAPLGPIDQVRWYEFSTQSTPSP
jgi:transcriptional regulator with XRE-family HTH domain